MIMLNSCGLAPSCMHSFLKRQKVYMTAGLTHDAADFVWAGSVLHCMPEEDCRAFLQSAYQLLKPGGFLYGMTAGKHESTEWAYSKDGTLKGFLYSPVKPLRNGTMCTCTGLQWLTGLGLGTPSRYLARAISWNACKLLSSNYWIATLYQPALQTGFLESMRCCLILLLNRFATSQHCSVLMLCSHTHLTLIFTFIFILIPILILNPIPDPSPILICFMHSVCFRATHLLILNSLALNQWQTGCYVQCCLSSTLHHVYCPSCPSNEPWVDILGLHLNGAATPVLAFCLNHELVPAMLLQASLKSFLRSLGFREVTMQSLDWSDLTTGTVKGTAHSDIITFYFTAIR